jgi:hypothetical protein
MFWFTLLWFIRENLCKSVANDFLSEDSGEESSDAVQHALVLGLGRFGWGRDRRRLHLRLEADWLCF